MFRLPLLLSQFFVASSRPVFQKSFSKISSSKFLSKARRLGNDGEVDYSWMTGYTLKFEYCFRSEDNEDLVIFRFCPRKGKCEKSCQYGDAYVTDMNYFLDSFTEAQLKAHEYACEMARENCGDDDGCYAEEGLDKCNDGEDKFNIQEYLTCQKYDENYYLGPYCSGDGESIYLGYFTENTCTNLANDGTFYESYGYELEYSTESIVRKSCVKCREHGKEEHQDEEDYDDEDNVLEQCEALYEYSSGCEENVAVDNPDTDACDLVSEVEEEYAKLTDGDWVGGISEEEQQQRSFSSLVAFTQANIIALLCALGICICCCACMYKATKSPAEAGDYLAAYE